ncbi:MAG: type II secretion system protein [Lentisphaeria bacterium]|nr:type II secretion system protein [Lentisphaeria bacterium]
MTTTSRLPAPVHPCPTPNGFTLLELLVVMAIMAVLAGMLLPALGRVRAKGRNVACVSNLKQLMTANHLYADANDDFFCPYERQDGRETWFGVEVRNKAWDMTSSPILGEYYSHAAQILLCPDVQLKRSFSPDLKAESLAEIVGGGGYAYNGVWFGGYTTGGQSVFTPRGRTRFPAATVVFSDAARSGVGSLTYPTVRTVSFLYCKVKPNGEVYDLARSGTNHFRHFRKCNTAWADGHVSSEAVGTLNTAHPSAMAASVGYLGAANQDFFNPVRTTDAMP